MVDANAQVLLNRERAREIMEREGLDALVAGVPINVYYLSSYWGFLMIPERFDAAYFAVFPRDPDRPAALVMPAFELRRLVSQGGTWMDEVFPYTAPAEDGLDIRGDIPGRPYPGWPVAEDAAMSDLEHRWIDVTRYHRERTAADALQSLGRALRFCELDSARIGTDEARLEAWLGQMGLTDATVQCDANLFNRVRHVKTAAEIELLKKAAIINQEALLESVDTLTEGCTWSDVERAYMVAMAKRGGQGVYVICGVGGLPAGRARPGEPVLLDSLGTYGQYHGDFGRCAVVGQPSAKHIRRHQALVSGWQAVLEMLKPGVSFNQLSEVAVDTVRKSGFKSFQYVTPHSVGLEHTDDPKPIGAPLGVKPDVTLQENMVINVDMPHTEIGWGSVHIEDTVRITATGCELLTTADLSIRSAGEA